MDCKLTDIYFKYGENSVLENINMDIHHGEIVSIIGPSGAGKTTLLKIITGLIEPTSGQISFNPTPSIEKPRIIVFQDYQLFPNMNVFNNIAFGLKARKVNKVDIKNKVLRYLDYFGLSDKLNNFPGQLSAGEKQRVAIARSMVLEPSILLLDEPFANLDYNLKSETAEFIRKTQKDFNVTTISVTHDQKEAFTMSDKIGVLLDGKLVELSNTKDLYHSPKSIKAAEFLGPVNKILPDNFKYITIDGQIPKNIIYVRANDIEIKSDNNGYGTITKIIYSGEIIRYIVTCNKTDYIVNSIVGSFNIGEKVIIKIKSYINKE